MEVMKRSSELGLSELLEIYNKAWNKVSPRRLDLLCIYYVRLFWRTGCREAISAEDWRERGGGVVIVSLYKGGKLSKK